MTDALARKIRVLVVDDSALVRRLLSEVLGADPSIEVIGTAADGEIALSKLEYGTADVVVLDVEMPGMTGLETLAAIKAKWPAVVVIMYSALAERGANVTIEALCRGATDYATKPSAQRGRDAARESVVNDLLPKIKKLAPRFSSRPSVLRAVDRKASALKTPARVASASTKTGVIDIVAIGCSTGGPNALSEVFGNFKSPVLVPIVIVQHMPPIFTELLARRLNQQGSVRVREAKDGDPLEPGVALVAPGDYHMEVKKEKGRASVVLHQKPAVNSCRPAVDVLFQSIAEHYAGRTLACVLTGMGTDGLNGVRLLQQLQATVLAQDEQSSVVWGMPGAIVNAGLADQVLPLVDVGGVIVHLLGRAGSRTPRGGGALRAG